LRPLGLEKLRGIRVPQYLSKVSDRSYYRECQSLAEKLRLGDREGVQESAQEDLDELEEEVTAEYLACLCSVLADLSPHLSFLVKRSKGYQPENPFNMEDLENAWDFCPYPIREFIFDKGLLRNTSPEGSDRLRLGFFWHLVLRNQSSHNYQGFPLLLGLFMRLGRSQTEKLNVLSKLRVCPSKSTLDAILPKILTQTDLQVPEGSLAVFAFDNHQQQLSMSGAARNLTRSNMVHSVTRSIRYLPDLPPGNMSQLDQQQLSLSSFRSSPKELAQIREANRQFTSFAAAAFRERGKQARFPPEIQLSGPIEEIQPTTSEDEDDEEDEPEEDERSAEENPTFDPSFPVEEVLVRLPRRQNQNSSLPPLYSRPSTQGWPEEQRVLFPEEADLLLPDDQPIKFTGKSLLKMMPQLLGRSEDPEMVKSTLRSFLAEMDERKQAKAFVMCDEKLYSICLKLSLSIASFSRFIFLLDPFHLGWNMEKVRASIFFKKGQGRDKKKRRGEI